MSKIIRTRHFGIVVKDMKRSIEFYQNVLGFQIKKEANETGEYLDKMLDLKNVQVKTVKMSINEDETLIELLEYSSPTSMNCEKRVFDFGVSHFALTVENLDELIINLKKNHVKLNSEPVISPDKKAKVAFCFDPDGSPIELVEEL